MKNNSVDKDLHQLVINLDGQMKKITELLDSYLFNQERLLFLLQYIKESNGESKTNNRLH